MKEVAVNNFAKTMSQYRQTYSEMKKPKKLKESNDEAELYTFYRTFPKRQAAKCMQILCSDGAHCRMRDATVKEAQIA